MYNPYWEILRAKNGPMSDVVSIQRNHLCRKYTWCIPDPKSLRLVAKHSMGRIVEIGAGRGYWAWQLSKLGVDVVAYDLRPLDSGINPWHSHLVHPLFGPTSISKKSYFHVQKGDAISARAHPDRTLMLCWPPYNYDMAYRALNHYKGDRLIYLGEHYGCCANAKFFERLEEKWKVLHKHECVRWKYINDAIWVYERT